MTTQALLSWHYLVFWLPMMASAFLMLLSSLRLGHHHGIRHGGGHMRVAAHSGGGGLRHHGAGAARHQAGAARAHSAGTSRNAAGGRDAHDGALNHHDLTHGQQQLMVHGAANMRANTPASVLLGLIGADRAPLPIVLQSFFLFWGFFGLFANLVFIHAPTPSLWQILPSLAIALVGGGLGARGAAEVAARILPPDESSVVSRDGLFGLTGEVTFGVSETAGRIFVYDEYGTLHDESCRVAPGQLPIEKGRRAIVLDKDEKGNLIVKEIV